MDKKESSVDDKVELRSLIANVKDVMCDLGEGFIEVIIRKYTHSLDYKINYLYSFPQRCLKHYNNNTETVINAILEDSLPAELKEIDRQLPYIPSDPIEEASTSADKALGMERLNVFDGDEFDIMTRDKIDASKVHRGKRLNNFFFPQNIYFY